MMEWIKKFVFDNWGAILHFGAIWLVAAAALIYSWGGVKAAQLQAQAAQLQSQIDSLRTNLDKVNADLATYKQDSAIRQQKQDDDIRWMGKEFDYIRYRNDFMMNNSNSNAQRRTR